MEAQGRAEDHCNETVLVAEVVIKIQAIMAWRMNSIRNDIAPNLIREQTIVDQNQIIDTRQANL